MTWKKKCLPTIETSLLKKWFHLNAEKFSSGTQWQSINQQQRQKLEWRSWMLFCCLPNRHLQFKVDNRNIATMRKIYSNLTIKTPNHVTDIVGVSLFYFCKIPHVWYLTGFWIRFRKNSITRVFLEISLKFKNSNFQEYFWTYTSFCIRISAPTATKIIVPGIEIC